MLVKNSLGEVVGIAADTPIGFAQPARRRASRGTRGKRKSRGRGSTLARVLRREYLIARYGVECNGELLVQCFHCKIPLYITDFEIDRWRLCGKHGGTYQRANVVPSCAKCNKRGPSNCCVYGKRLVKRRGA
jgi:hypothetical protein